MFTDKLNLPIKSDPSSRADQILSLSNMTWADYEAITSAEYPGYRAAFFQGVITIVSPSQNHEAIAETIGDLVKVYCRQANLLYFPMGSTTLKNSPLAGKEPDQSFAFEQKKAFPDLAIEVIYSSGDIHDSLQKYQYLGIKEVWFWQSDRLSFYRLENLAYQTIEESVCLPKIIAESFSTFVNRGLTESPLTIEADFIEELKF